MYDDVTLLYFYLVDLIWYNSKKLIRQNETWKSFEFIFSSLNYISLDPFLLISEMFYITVYVCFYLDRFLWISLDVKQWLQRAPFWAPVCWTDEGDEGFPVLTGGPLYPRDWYLLPHTKWMEEWWIHKFLLRHNKDTLIYYGKLSWLLLAHLSWKLKWAFLIACYRYICLSLTFHIFIFFKTIGPISI